MGYDLVLAGDASPRRLKAPRSKRDRRKRARVALRLRLDLVKALDGYVEQLKDDDGRVTRTSVIERAIKMYLKKKKVL